MGSIGNIIILFILLGVLVVARNTMDFIDWSLVSGLALNIQTGIKYFVFQNSYFLFFVPLVAIIAYIVLVLMSQFTKVKKGYLVAFPFIYQIISLGLTAIIIVCTQNSLKRPIPKNTENYWRLYQSEQPECIAPYVSIFKKNKQQACKPYGSPDIREALLICSLQATYQIVLVLVNLSKKNEEYESDPALHIVAVVGLYICKLFYFTVTAIYWVSEITFGTAYFSDIALGLIIMGIVNEFVLMLCKPSDIDDSVQQLILSQAQINQSQKYQDGNYNSNGGYSYDYKDIYQKKSIFNGRKEAKDSQYSTYQYIEAEGEIVKIPAKK